MVENNETDEQEKAPLNDFMLKYYKYRTNDFYQQLLPAWRPKPTFAWSAILFAFFGALCSLVGLAML
jgi:hypothetical protein